MQSTMEARDIALASMSQLNHLVITIGVKSDLYPMGVPGEIREIHVELFQS